MATSNKTHRLVLVLFFFILASNSLMSSARLTPMDPSFNVLALPLHHRKSEQDPKPQVVLPCHHHHMVPTKNSHVRIIRHPSPRLVGKYGPMILSMLPRGPVPSSGPSKGTNDIKN
ncbi:hypothetical protein PTKIN_Ptkin16aG0002800 [Pterospermum kingtungense]